MRIDQPADHADDATTVHLQVHGSHVLTELGWAPLLQGVLARNAVALAMHHAPYRIASNGVDMDEDGEPIMDDEEEEEEEDGVDGGEEEDGDAEGGHSEDGPAVGGHALLARTMLAVLNRGCTVAQSGAVGLQLSHAINALALSAQAGLKRSLHLVLPGTRRGYASFAAHVLRVAAIVAWTALRQHHQQQQQQQQQQHGVFADGVPAAAMLPDDATIRAALGMQDRQLDIDADESLRELTTGATLAVQHERDRWAHVLACVCDLAEHGHDEQLAPRLAAHALLALLAEPAHAGCVSLLEQALRLAVFVVQRDGRLAVMNASAVRKVRAQTRGGGGPITKRGAGWPAKKKGQRFGATHHHHAGLHHGAGEKKARPHTRNRPACTSLPPRFVRASACNSATAPLPRPPRDTHTSHAHERHAP